MAAEPSAAISQTRGVRQQGLSTGATGAGYDAVMRVRGLLVLVAAFCLCAPAAVAQTAAPGKPDVTAHLPSGTWLLVVVGLGLAAYISYSLGRKREDEHGRREGPISKALSGNGRAKREGG